METKNQELQLTQATLDEFSASELNDKIVSLPTFLCKRCDKFLMPPIILVADLGNVCGDCIDDPLDTSTRNVALEAVLELLLVPCRYCHEGCTEKLPYVEISKHASMCIYRNYRCPLKLFVGCMWEGRRTDLLNHGASNHRDFVIIGDCNLFMLNLDISKDDEIVKLLSIDDKVFILHIKSDLHALKQQYAIYYIGDVNIAHEFLFSAVQTGCSGLDSINLGSGNALKDVDFKRFMNTAVFEVDLALIKQFVNDQIMSVKIKIVHEGEANNLPAVVLSNLECPVCKNYMRPPIIQCLSGHSVCNRCCPKLKNCPTCRSGFGQIQNFSLEAICKNIKYPCIYRDAGCNVVLKHTDVDKHEAECPLKSYTCPFDDFAYCLQWAGPLNVLIDHLKRDHQGKVIIGNYNKVTIPFSCDTYFYSLYCMIVDKHLFKISHKRDIYSQSSYWAAQLIGPRGECNNYRYEIGLINGSNEHKRLVRVDLVQEMSKLDDMFNQCISIPSGTASWFDFKEQITYYCKIIKIK